MKITIYLCVFGLTCSYLFSSCAQTTSKEVSGEAIGELPLEEKVQVNIEPLKDTNFYHQTVSNGKLTAYKKSSLYFGYSEKLLKLNVRNGQKVNKGDTIACLNISKLQQKQRQAKTALLKAELDLQDILIGRGLNTTDTANIPRQQLKMARLRSGYLQAANELRAIQTELKGAVLTSPFAGVVANISKKQYEQVIAGETFCTLLDNSQYQVEFQVLETELNKIALKQEISIEPFYTNNATFTGHITEINPVIDKNGLVQVKGLVNGTPTMMDGMNVKVFIQEKLPNQLVVPRSAVVLRQNQEVLFKYTKGKAYWTYVNITNENSTHYTVVPNKEKGATLNSGDTIIVSNNLNLAHDSEVSIQGTILSLNKD